MANSDLRSPFVDRMLNLLSHGHEDALKHAFYNAVAICSILAVAAAAMAVYFILEPFVQPLLWAVLVGSVLHPVKYKSAIIVNKWLSSLKSCNTPFVLGMCTVPLQIIDLTGEWIGITILSHLSLLISIVIGLSFVYLFLQYCPVPFIISLYETLSSPCEYFTLNFQGLSISVVLTVVIGLTTTLGILFGHVPCLVVKTAFHIFWTLLFIIVINSCGSFKLVIISVIILSVSMRLVLQFDWIKQATPDLKLDHDKVALDVGTPQEIERNRPSESKVETAKNVRIPSNSTSEYLPSQSKTSNQYIYGVLWACIVIQLWQRTWLLHLFPIPFVYYLFKSVGSYFGIWRFLHAHVIQIRSTISQWLIKNKDVIFPPFVRWLYKAVIQLDGIIIHRLEQQVDVVVTVVIIFVVLVLTVLSSIFLTVQIYGESVHLVHFGTRLINETLRNPDTQQWLPQDMDQMFGSVVDNAYMYGRTGIATFIKNSIQEKDPVRAAQIEHAIMETWDRMRGAWLAQESPNQRKIPTTKSFMDGLTHIPDVANGTLDSNRPLFRRLSQDYLNVTVLLNYGKENIGMFVSILESVWAILKGNMNLVFKTATALLSIVLGGGTAILNFFVNVVVFLTALYYLLVASDSQYKPAQILSLLSPGTGNTLGIAVEEAISTVFMASFKLGLFYGLWTWLIHTIFQVNFVVIPAALATLLGAVPFLGTYWAALPAVLDLWLTQNRSLEAVMLMLSHFVPTLLVDACFYSEIKGGGHPYLTGLAVAGGIFWLGFKGAIIGPLLLCVLLVAITLYSSFMHNTIPVDANSRWIHRRLFRLDTVG